MSAITTLLLTVSFSTVTQCAELDRKIATTKWNALSSNDSIRLLSLIECNGLTAGNSVQGQREIIVNSGVRSIYNTNRIGTIVRLHEITRSGSQRNSCVAGGVLCALEGDPRNALRYFYWYLETFESDRYDQKRGPLLRSDRDRAVDETKKLVLKALGGPPE